MELSTEAMETLFEYDWPGNVRELRTVIEHGVVMSNGSKIGVRHLPPFLKNDSLRHLREAGKESPASEITAPTAVDPTAGENLNLAKMEEKMIRLALERTGDNRTEAARLLGISRRTMQRKLKEMGLVDD